MSPPTRRLVVICPLAHEAAAIGRELRGMQNVLILISGPGAAALRRAVRELIESRDQQPGVLLAGVAGALAPLPPAFFIQSVIDSRGERYTPSIRVPSDDPMEGVTLLGVDAALTTPAQKREWHARTGAELVDMESHVLARTCTERNIPWGVVRGVSDTADESLPPEVLEWVRPDGRTKLLRPIADILTRPRLLPAAVRLARRSASSLPEVARQVALIARAWTMQ